MSQIENQLVSFIKSALSNGDKTFIEDFVKNGPIPGGADGASRYLLAVAMNDVSPERLAEIAGVSIPVAQHLKGWLDAGTRV